MLEVIKTHIEKNYAILDEEEQKELLQIALQSLKNESIELKQLLESSNDKDIILNKAHKLKGVLLNAGLSDIAKEFEEENLKNLPLYDIKNKISNFVEILSKI